MTHTHTHKVAFAGQKKNLVGRRWPKLDCSLRRTHGGTVLSAT